MLGSAGDGNDWSVLYRYLRDEGWRVDLFDAVPRAGGDGVEEAMPPLDGVDAALVVVARSRRSKVQTSGRLHHTVGVLQGQLGFGRVMVLSERGVDAYPSATGVSEVRFDRDDIAAVLDQVDGLLVEMAGEDRSAALEAADAGWWETVVGGRPPLAPERMLAGVAVVLVLATVGLMAWVLSADSSSDRPVVRAETLPPGATSSPPPDGGTAGGVSPPFTGPDGQPLGPGPTGTYPTPRPAPTPAPTGTPVTGTPASPVAPSVPLEDGATRGLYPPGGGPNPTVPAP